jgi:hypothetical protein
MCRPAEFTIRTPRNLVTSNFALKLLHQRARQGNLLCCCAACPGSQSLMLATPVSIRKLSAPSRELPDVPFHTSLSDPQIAFRLPFHFINPDQKAEV